MEGNNPVAGSSIRIPRRTRGQIANELKRRMDEQKWAAAEKRQRMMFVPRKIIGRNDIFLGNGLSSIKTEKEDGFIKQELEFLEANSSSASVNMQQALEQFSKVVEPEHPFFATNKAGGIIDSCGSPLPENDVDFGDSEENKTRWRLDIMEEIKLEETDSVDMQEDKEHCAPSFPEEPPLFSPSESGVFNDNFVPAVPVKVVPARDLADVNDNGVESLPVETPAFEPNESAVNFDNDNCAPQLPENEVASGASDQNELNESLEEGEILEEIELEADKSEDKLEDSVIVVNDDDSDPEISNSVSVERYKREPPDLEEISSLDTVLSAPEPDLASNDMCEEKSMEGDENKSELRREVEELRARVQEYKSQFGDLSAFPETVEEDGLTVFTNALPILDAHLDCQTFLALRSCCKTWQMTLDHFLETRQLQRSYLQVFEKLTHKPRKSVLLDLEKKYTFTTPENINRFLETVDSTLENPLLGNSMVLELTAKSLGFFDQSVAVLKYYDKKINAEGVNEKLCAGLDKLCKFYWNRVELILHSYGEQLTCLTFYQYELGLTPNCCNLK